MVIAAITLVRTTMRRFRGDVLLKPAKAAVSTTLAGVSLPAQTRGSRPSV
jgi:hypothetical protein